MIKVENLTTPSPEQFEVVIHGMRNAFKSWDKSDSGIAYKGVDGELVEPEFYLGEKDKQLLLNLCKAGDPSHRKVLRQLPVIMDIKAPHYWWKQMSTYKIGTTANSESLMHTACKEPFTFDDFSVEALGVVDEPEGLGSYANLFGHYAIEHLNHMRDMYLKAETPEERHQWELAIFSWIPECFNQTRTWSANYEVLVNIIRQRENHKLIEWTQFCDYLLDNVPYLREICEAVNENNYLTITVHFENSRESYIAAQFLRRLSEILATYDDYYDQDGCGLNIIHLLDQIGTKMIDALEDHDG